MVETIKTHLGQPFSLAPDFSKTEDVYADGSSLVEGFPFTVKWLGMGQVDVVRVSDDALQASEVAIRTPAGPIATQAALENGLPKTSTATQPVRVAVLVYGVNKNDLAQVHCELHYAGERFGGDPTLDEIAVQDKRQGSVTLPAVSFQQWVDLATDEVVQVFLPQDQTIFSQVQLIIDKLPVLTTP